MVGFTGYYCGEESGCQERGGEKMLYVSQLPTSDGDVYPSSPTPHLALQPEIEDSSLSAAAGN